MVTHCKHNSPTPAMGKNKIITILQTLNFAVFFIDPMKQKGLLGSNNTDEWSIMVPTTIKALVPKFRDYISSTDLLGLATCINGT